MLELFINKKEDEKQILLTEEGKLIEYYNSKNIENRNEGNIFIGIVKDILVGMNAAFVDIGTEKNSYIQAKDIIPQLDEKKAENKEKRAEQDKIDIRKIIKPNQRLLVQVRKDSNELKGARITTHITIPSKYIVFMPNTDIITISQKIINKQEQERLLKIVKENIGAGNGAVIRTSAIGKEQEIIDDIKRVKVQWEKIKQEFQSSAETKPKILYKSPSILQKMLIDLPSRDIETIISNDKKELDDVKKFVSEDKELKDVEFKLVPTKKLESTYDLNSQVEKIEKRKIWLKCGGFITIDPTEALTAIDVNTGKYTEGKNLNDIIYKVNEQATHEIAKQIRLRDIGGIIIIDYIDMFRKGDKEKIQETLEEILKEDRAKTQVEGFTKLNLMEMTRKHICSHKD
ncbi:MAG: Rne/Rng family ribonuclease [Clostridia bacterium]|nr:Rne/Rng family ribonuclease [Clostridia bacterium]